MSKFTAEDVRDILGAFATEFLVDIPAVHNKNGYWLEFSQLSASLLLADNSWYQDIADHVNGESDS